MPLRCTFNDRNSRFSVAGLRSLPAEGTRRQSIPTGGGNVITPGTSLRAQATSMLREARHQLRLAKVEDEDAAHYMNGDRGDPTGNRMLASAGKIDSATQFRMRAALYWLRRETLIEARQTLRAIDRRSESLAFGGWRHCCMRNTNWPHAPDCALAKLTGG